MNEKGFKISKTKAINRVLKIIESETERIKKTEDTDMGKYFKFLYLLSIMDSKITMIKTTSYLTYKKGRR